MLESGGELDLAQEPVGTQARGELGVEGLQRHGTVVPEIVSQEDGRHTAATQLALDPKAVRQGSLKPSGVIHFVPSISHRSPPLGAARSNKIHFPSRDQVG